eukprot:9042200-Pyramimonas_sp.AAC.1
MPTALDAAFSARPEAAWPKQTTSTLIGNFALRDASTCGGQRNSAKPARRFASTQSALGALPPS